MNTFELLSFMAYLQGSAKYLAVLSAVDSRLPPVQMGLIWRGKANVCRSLVISQLQERFRDPRIAVVYIYCNYKEQTLQNFPNILGSLCAQLVDRQQYLSANATSLYDTHNGKRTRPSTEELRKLLASELRNFNTVFLLFRCSGRVHVERW